MASAARDVLEAAGNTWDNNRKEFRTASGLAIQFLYAGERAGNGSEVKLPEPDDRSATTELEGLPVLSLGRLIKSKLASGQGNLRRTHKDFSDVVELLALHNLSRHLLGICTNRSSDFPRTRASRPREGVKC